MLVTTNILKVKICRGSKYEQYKRMKRIEKEIHHIERLDEITYSVEAKLNKPNNVPE